MKDPRRIHQRGGDRWSRRVPRAGLILDETPDDGACQLRWEHVGFFVDRAEAVLVAVVAAEPERLGLEAAARGSGCQSTTEGLQVEERDS